MFKQIKQHNRITTTIPWCDNKNNVHVEIEFMFDLLNKYTEGLIDALKLFGLKGWISHESTDSIKRRGEFVEVLRECA